MKFFKNKEQLRSMMLATMTLITMGHSMVARADFIAPDYLKYLCHEGGGEYYEKSDGSFGCRYNDGTKISCDLFGRFCSVKEPGKIKIVAPNNRETTFDKLKEKLHESEQVVDSYTPINKKSKSPRLIKLN